MSDHTYRRCTIEYKQFGSDPDTPANHLSFITDPLYRVRIEGVKDSEGNGLGSVIIRSIAEQHKGQISVTSVPGQGSCFTFFLPLTQYQPVKAASSEFIS